MANYLVTLSLGPVQSLIGAARRTRDLWSGSWLLSEVSRAAALVFYDAAPSGLIFPAPPQSRRDLEPQDRPGDSANIANILRVEVMAADDAAVRALCQRAKAAAQTRLQQLAEQAYHELRCLRESAWKAQLGDQLESFAAWVRIENGDYAAASQRLGKLLAARKATRDFTAAAIGNAGFGVPKSSLDGAFESVLPDKPGVVLTRKLQLSKGEQLDALGVIKRRAGETEQFTAYSRLAADPWLYRLTPEQRERLAACYEPLVKLELATRVKGNQDIYKDFAYDAQLLFDFRLQNALEDHRYEADAVERLAPLHKTLHAIYQEKDSKGQPCGVPVPYAVILQADGDRMGELLSRATTADESRQISQALQAFADSVRGLVREHRGHAIYAGGDDVLALLPLPNAVRCSKALAALFKEKMSPVALQLGVPQAVLPSLSVGLGVGHLVEPLGRLRQRAGRAEKLAKGNDLPDETQRRNAIALLLGIRSGGEIGWRARWDQLALLDELKQMTQAYWEGQLSSRVAYDLRAIDQRLNWLQDAKYADIAMGMRLAEVARMLDRARTHGGSDRIDSEMQKYLLQQAKALLLQQAKTAKTLRLDKLADMPLAKLADTLIIARWLAARKGSELERG